MKKIVICMGSSCFARGNNRNLEIIERYLAQTCCASQSPELRGSCCEEKCSDGPNISIDGRLLHRVDAGVLNAVLEEACDSQQVGAAGVSGSEDGADE